MMDLRYALRNLARDRGFASIALLTLALGIAANTVIFSIFDAVLLRPLAFRQPDRLYAIQEVVRALGKIGPQIPVNAQHFGEWRRHSHSFEQLGMIGGASFNLTSGGDPERIPGARVSASIFPVLGVVPQIGRAFLESEDADGHDQVVLIGDGLWTRRFHRDPNIIGQKILLNGSPFEVVGVLPARPLVPSTAQVVSLPFTDIAPQIWKPFAVRDQELSPFGDFNYGCIGRLKPGVLPAQATADLDAIARSIAQRLGENVELRASLTPLQEQLTGTSRNSLVLLLTAVGAVLLIVCVNIASLMLIRTTGRRRELAIRIAIGASGARLLRQILTEALVLAMCGGVLGIAMAYALLGVVVHNAPVTLPRLDEIRIDGWVLAFSLALSLATGALFGLLPGWRFARVDPNEALKSSGRALTEGRKGGRTRSLLIGLEVALSAMTLIAAGLLLNSFVHLLRVDKGFRPEHAMVVSLHLPEMRYPSRQRIEFFRTLLDDVSRASGVTAAGISNMLPLAGEGSNNSIVLEGEQTAASERRIVDFRGVSPGYFRAIGIPLMAGRIFDEHDQDRSLALVSARAAQTLWPGVSPIGKRFHLGSTQNRLLEVIGVTGDVRGVSLQKDPNLTVYLPYWQRDRADVALVVRAERDARAAAAAVRQEIRRLDSQLPIPDFRTLQDMVDRSVAARRFQMNLVLVFGAAALLLAALGVYGAVSYSVAQRTNEMGIRMVLGATGTDVRWLVLRQGLAPVLAGLAAGIVLALMLSRLLSGFLFGVRASDPLTFSAVACMVIAVSVAGCYIPALRATSVDPAVALRYE